MKTDSLTLAAVAAELRRRATGPLGWVVVPRREQVVIALPRGGFRVSIAAADPRAHLVDQVPPSPRPEPSIQTHLDSLLRGGELLEAATVRFDRVLCLEIANLDRIGEPRRYRVMIELMGKHSAFTVVDEQGLILATLKPVSRAVNRHRELLPRVPYVPPPGDLEDPLALTAESFAAAWPALTAAPSLKAGWRATWYGLSDELWDYLCRVAGLSPEPEPAETTRERLWAAWQETAGRLAQDDWAPCLVRRDGRPVQAWPLPLPGGEPRPTVSAAIAEVAAAAGRRDELAERRGQLVGVTRKALARAESNLEGFARRARRAAEADRWQHQADLLLANLHGLTPHAAQVTLPDYDGQPQEIALDPKLTGPQNAEALYQRARKARQGAAGLAEEEARWRAERERLGSLLTALRECPDLAGLERLAPEVPVETRPTAPPKPRTERERALQRVGRQTSRDGFTILIGRNAAESEGLLSRVAAPSDLWLHVRGAGSGHVIIRTEGRPETVPPTTLEEAARWAARYSKMKHSELVPVVYTQRKHVTKIKGGAAGKVVYRHEKTIFVTPNAG